MATGGEQVALVAGATGINGYSIAGKLLESGDWKVYGTGRRARPEWLHQAVEYVQVDLLNKEDTLDKVGALRKIITHLFWATWLPMPTEEQNCEANGKMLRHTLDALTDDGSSLRHVCLTTGAKHYLGPFEKFGSNMLCSECPFREDAPRLPVPNFYYVQEDILQETVATRNLSYSVHRPSNIFGFAPRNYMNLLTALAVYATLCKEDEQLKFQFPGTPDGWERLMDASDAELIAEQEIWAATNPAAKNQAFNITNGDVFKWKRMWSVLASELGVEAAPYGGKQFKLAELLGGRTAAWDAIVTRYGLVPTRLEEVGQFWFVDTVLGLGPVDVVSSMNKSREFGFLASRDSEKSALHWIRVLKNKRIIP